MEEARPVVHAEAQHPAVNEVEGRREYPFLFGIIDFELAIWGHPSRLYRGEIGTEYVSIWVLVGEFDGPNAGTSANV